MPNPISREIHMRSREIGTDLDLWAPQGRRNYNLKRITTATGDIESCRDEGVGSFPLRSACMHTGSEILWGVPEIPLR